MADRPVIKPQEVRAWRARWTPDRLAEIDQHLTKYWQRASAPRQRLDLTPFGLSHFGGRIDLRGFTLGHALACFEVTRVDFSGLQFSQAGQLGPYSRFVDCRFERGCLRGNVREEFDRCSFDGADLHRAVLGRTFVGCSFRSANLRASLVTGAVFRDCVFERADLRHVQWQMCRFHGCRFAAAKFDRGSLSRSSFDDCQIDRAVLEQAGVLLDGVSLGEAV